MMILFHPSIQSSCVYAQVNLNSENKIKEETVILNLNSKIHSNSVPGKTRDEQNKTKKL